METLIETQLLNTAQRLGISNHEADLIFAIVVAFPKNDLFANIHCLERELLGKIKAGHYVLLSFIVGYLNATEKTYSEFIKNNEPCQRVN